MGPLNSDALGKMGEFRFASLCVEAGLFVNSSSDWDRTGWDFIVEFPFGDRTETETLERRASPPDCLVQVKTVWSNGNNVKLRLSSAERLAKKLQPCIIVVLGFDRGHVLREIYGIHLFDTVLGDILKEIRKCDLHDSLKINKTDIRLNYRKIGVEIEASAPALRGFIESVASCDRQAYVKSKRHQIDSLGFIGNPYGVIFSLHARTPDEIMDVMLGLKRARISDLSVIETRWGIPKPLESASGSGEIFIKPKERSGWILAKDSCTREAVRLRVSIVTSERISTPHGNLGKIRIYNEMLELMVQVDDKCISFSFASDDLPPLLLDQLIALNKFQRIISGLSGEFELQDSRGRRLWGTVSTSAVSADDHESRDSADLIMMRLRDIFEAAGTTEIKLFSKSLYIQRELIEFMFFLVKKPDEISEFSFRVSPVTEWPFKIASVVEALVLARLSFADSAVAVCAVGSVTIPADRLDGNVKELQVSRLSLREVAVIEDSAQAAEEFGQQMEADTGIRFILWLGDVSDAHQFTLHSSELAPTEMD